MMDKLEAFLNRFIGPLAQKLSESDHIQAMAEGFMRTGPITFGVFLFAVLGNLPIDALTNFLTSTGLKSSLDAVYNAGLNILSLYVSFTIAYSYAKRKNENAVSSGLLSLMSFLIIIPQVVAGAEGDVTAFSLDYLGGNGVLAALVISLVVSSLYCALAKHGLKFKMPDGVPPMVADSLEPMFIAMIIAVLAFGIRVGFSLTPYGNFVDFFQNVIGNALTGFALNVPFMIVLVFLANLIWFFGIHPNTLYSPVIPMMLIMATTNIADFQAGNELTYLAPALAYYFAGLGGSGNTLGLSFAMLTAKSKRYKQMTKIGLIPNLFNINEPLIFGMPVMLNPVFFIPMVINCIIMGLVGVGLATIFPFAYNPTVALLPFAVPFFLRTFIGGGVTMTVIACVCVAISALVYFPFFKIADRRACEEEAAAELEAAAAEKGASNE